MSRRKLIAVLILLALPISRPNLAFGQDAGDDIVRLKAGNWVAAVKTSSVGNLLAHVPSFRNQVVRQGPDEANAVQLFEEVSSRIVVINLRDDGLLLVQPGDIFPRLYFPGSNEAVELKLPPPEHWKQPFPSSNNMGKTWFLEDLLFYDREADNHRLMGFVRIDFDSRKLGESKLCLDIAGDSATASAARISSPVFLFAKEYVLWVNEGYYNAYFPNSGDAKWRSKKLRALSLSSAKLIDPATIPKEALTQNKEQLLTFLEKQVHNHSAVFEIWAVDQLSRIAEKKDAARLKALSLSVRETIVEDVPNHLRTTDKPVKEAYATALDVLQRDIRP